MEERGKKKPSTIWISWINFPPWESLQFRNMKRNNKNKKHEKTLANVYCFFLTNYSISRVSTPKLPTSSLLLTFLPPLGYVYISNFHETAVRTLNKMWWCWILLGKNDTRKRGKKFDDLMSRRRVFHRFSRCLFTSSHSVASRFQFDAHLKFENL